MTPLRKEELLSMVQYPQFTPNESMVARAWLVKHVDEWDSIDFNVNVGNATALPLGTSESILRQAAAVSTKRIDMVCKRDDTVRLIECKVRISLYALGQLLGYEILWRVEHPETRYISIEAIGYSALIDVHDILLSHGVIVELFPNIALMPYPAG